MRNHAFVLAGTAKEFNGETEMIDFVYVKDEGPATIPAPAVSLIAVLKDNTCDSNQNLNTGEDREDMLVRVEGVKCVENRNPGQSFLVTTVSTGTDTLLISEFSVSSPSFTNKPDSNEVLNVQGILHFTNGSYRICPRSNADIESLTVLAAPNVAPERISLGVFPNPGNSPRVTFDLPRTDDVELGVYDLAGRRVAVLARGRFAPGSYSRIWGGLDSRGKASASGVYFYRLKLGLETRVVRAVRL